MRDRLRTALLSSAAVAVLAGGALASSHREAPGITKSPKVDGTDFYMFRSYEPGREGFVTFIANFVPLQAPYGGPNYFTMDPDAIYEIHIDNNGDAIEDLTFQFQFRNTLRNGVGLTVNAGGLDLPIALRAAGPVRLADDPNLGELETYTLSLIRGDRRSGARAPVLNAVAGGTSFTKPVDFIGSKTLPDYEAYANALIHTVAMPGCDAPGRVFAGQRAEAFAVNLGPVFDLVNFIPVERDFLAPGVGIAQNRANDDVVGEFNVTSLAVEVPISCLVGAGNGVIGGWFTASLPQSAIQDPTPTYEANAVSGGAFVQKSRLSNPLVNELVIGLNRKDAFNASEPKDDAQFADFVTNPTLPVLLNALFRDPVNQVLGASIPDLAPSNFPRADLVAAFLTGFDGVNMLATVTPSEMIRLNTAVPPTPREAQSTFGVAGGDLAGFPNGRRPGDDVVDLALRVVMGRLCHPIPFGGDTISLGLCEPGEAPTGLVPFTDGAPISAVELRNSFPYLNTPIPGAPNDPAQ